ncbi:hypothetical protein [Photobacterium atrarenae]|uniref:Uncharacterized protein n=1 Tax=Photobacterium atrarenae TaxID=865757 RepID=A0ABY5GB89_9GAMM|nr:hypothetical protein [Photobacterium atrarenae]UTV26417.1 hypothetical protein NNL38_08480 [Photobacterium atrarenae]
MNQQIKTAQEIEQFWQSVETKAKAIRLRLKAAYSPDSYIQNEHHSAVYSLQSLLQEQGEDRRNSLNDNEKLSSHAYSPDTSKRPQDHQPDNHVPLQEHHPGIQPGN